MRDLLIGLAALVGGSSAAQGANWALVATASDGMRTYLDVSSVGQSGSSRTTWEKSVNGKVKADGEAYVLGHWRYDCESRTVTLLSMTHYRADASYMRSEQPAVFQQKAFDVVPETVGEKVLDLVCSALK